ncbi:PASTA domain-containing protein [Eggerthella sinensis]|uniref:PASTA domain-containing protein n=1 Tax=Eggerthella sinensis TaxID=242230 RepID=UPI00266BBD99|nr:PASTA domain-containing protein [Eggerthella sinensis]
MICPQCQSENRDDAKFCNECGFPLSGRIAQVAAATAAIEEAEQAAKAERVAEARDEAADELDPDFEGVVSADEPVAEPADDDKPDTSGPLDRATLPAIDVAGVNVDENGNAFDFGSVDDGANDVAPAADDLSAFVPRRPDDDPSATARNDFSGFDECLVDAGYVPPQKTWGPGDTMEMPRIEGQAAPKQKEFRAPDANKKKGGKGKAALIVLACLLVIGVAAAGTTYYLELWGGKMLPDVVGMTQADAVSVLESKGFAVREEKVKSDATEGVVQRMDPGAGAREEKGTEVTIEVSEARTIPEAVGMQRDEVAALLADAGFENVKFVTEKSDEHEGLVLSIDPEVGTKAQANTPVTVTAAVPYTVPDVAGKTWDEASKLLQDAGYEPVASYIYDDSVAPGTALSTDPAAGAKADSGSSVTVSVALSRGSELEQAAQNYLGGLVSSGEPLSIGGTAYLVESVDAVKYEGGETTSFTITGKAVTSLDGETVYGSSKQKSGSIVWTSDNMISSVS